MKTIEQARRELFEGWDSKTFHESDHEQDGDAVEVVTTWHPDSRSYEEQIVKHDTKGSRKSLGAMNAKLRAKVGRLERELAALSANHSEQVREGWKLVPVKPSIDMVEAGYEASLGCPDRGSYARVIEQYDAMLSAAPSAGSQIGESIAQ